MNDIYGMRSVQELCTNSPNRSGLGVTSETDTIVTDSDAEDQPEQRAWGEGSMAVASGRSESQTRAVSIDVDSTPTRIQLQTHELMDEGALLTESLDIVIATGELLRQEPGANRRTLRKRRHHKTIDIKDVVNKQQLDMLQQRIAENERMWARLNSKPAPQRTVSFRERTQGCMILLSMDVKCMALRQKILLSQVTYRDAMRKNNVGEAKKETKVRV